MMICRQLAFGFFRPETAWGDSFDMCVLQFSSSPQNNHHLTLILTKQLNPVNYPTLHKMIVSLSETMLMLQLCSKPDWSHNVSPSPKKIMLHLHCQMPACYLNNLMCEATPSPPFTPHLWLSLHLTNDRPIPLSEIQIRVLLSAAQRCYGNASRLG